MVAGASATEQVAGRSSLSHRLSAAADSRHLGALCCFYEQCDKAGFKFSAKGPWRTILGFGVERDPDRETSGISYHALSDGAGEVVPA